MKWEFDKKEKQSVVSVHSECMSSSTAGKKVKMPLCYDSSYLWCFLRYLISFLVIHIGLVATNLKNGILDKCVIYILK